MRILQLCHKPPLPSVDGGAIAIHQITQGLLQEGIKVKVLAISTPKHPVEVNNLPRDYVAATRFETVFVNTDLNKWQAIRSILRSKSYHVARFYSKEMINALIRILQRETFDIIHLESLFVSLYIPLIRKYSKAKIVYRAHNIEHRIWKNVLKYEKNFIKRVLRKMLYKQLKKFELNLWSQLDGYMAISEHDYQYFHQLAPNLKGATIPFGVNLERYQSDARYIPSDRPKLFHLGSMNWLPNQEGISWFLEEVWGLIHDKFPDITFTIAGRNMPPQFTQLDLPNIIIEQDVPDACQFMLSNDIMIVPLLSGGGIRVKIVEGMALSKIIIATSMGVQGLAVEDGKNIFIADTPEEFVEAIAKCIKTPDICAIIGENAMEYVALHHSNEQIIDNLLQFYRDVIIEGRWS